MRFHKRAKDKLKASFFAAALLVTLTMTIEGQTGRWVRVAPVGEEFTVLMPHQPGLKKEDGPNGQRGAVRVYGVNTDGGIYIVRSSTRPPGVDDEALINPLAGEYEQAFFKEIRRQGGLARLIKKSDLTLNGFKGREYVLSLGDTPCVVRVYASKRRVYTLVWLGLVLANLPGPAHQDSFLESFTLGPINKSVAASNVRVGEDSRTSNNRGTGPGCGGPGCGTGAGRTSAGSAPFNGDDTRIFSSRDAIQKARILSKPQPQHTAEARRREINGTVILRVVLRADGQVTDIQPVKGLPYGLTEMAIEAARRVKFTPALKDGRAVSQSVHLEYSFNTY